MPGGAPETAPHQPAHRCLQHGPPLRLLHNTRWGPGYPVAAWEQQHVLSNRPVQSLSRNASVLTVTHTPLLHLLSCGALAVHQLQ